jgi:hypothetical protein
VPWVPGSEPLKVFFSQNVQPYLSAKSGKSLPLGRPEKAAALFHDLKVRLNPEAHRVLERLQELCDQRRQFDFQMQLHHWLYAWMTVHLVLSSAMLVLMIAHGYLALRYL